MRQVSMHRLSQFVFYIMGYLLLLEWLYPLKALTDIDNMYIFFIFLALPFLLHCLKLKTSLKTVLLVLYIIWATYFLYYSAFSFFNIQWIIAFISDVSQSIVSLFQLDINNMSFSFQTLLLFFLLWVMTYLIHYWVMIQRSIFLFFFLSVLYVTILDTFTPYNGDWAIVRLFIIGLLLLGNLTFFRLIQRESLFISPKQYSIWLLPLVFMIVLSSMLGFASPKFPAQWPDPVPFFVSYSEKFKDDKPSVNKVGYGLDDSTLGGDFIGDDTTVFVAKTSEKHYWKVESKSIYSGKGWYAEGNTRIESFDNGQAIPEGCCSQNVKQSKLLVDEVDVKLPYVHIPYAEPMAESTIISQDSERGANVSFLYTPMNNRVVSLDLEQQHIKLDRYRTVYRMPVFDKAKLQEVKGMPETELFRTYTELPDFTPNDEEVQSRLRQLAESITEGKTNWYDKAKAIEDYFDKPEFIYDHENIPYPKENQDFVEQFVFDTKRGYCDHFSTSMAVLLRTIGIPTRWVKGYTEGEYKKYEDGKIVYEITNNNAHSWVEVFFPNIGWVPFEPTKGYNNPTRFENTKSNTATQDKTPEQEKEATKKPEPKETEKNTPKTQTSFNDKVKVFIEKWSDNWQMVVASIGLIVLIVMALFMSRRRWLPYIWFWYFSRKDTEETFVKAYEVLLKQLQRSGLKRMQNQTLREYANFVDETYQINEMSELTFYYEKVVYRGENSMENWKQAKILWKKVMKTTIT
ncbi:transglutaminase-like domain-containing protein [Bacillus massiliigorillae]|uniref:transglutaminase-like domain-containing protein n=1 Tax=Bacillus massiliigorillae TaxID=1243664 RepID=UPI000399BB29|nr:transglutaminase-like domain-containing protein [Bacillus massiliigorillae]